MGERILITGGAGFIGSHLAKRHLAERDEVHLLVRPGGPSRPERIQPGATVHEVDLSDVEAVEDCLASAMPTIIYHLASGTGRDLTIPNPLNLDLLTEDLRNLLTLLAAAADSRRPPTAFVRSGSLAVYGNGPVPSTEDQREQPLTVYTTAMVAGGHYCQLLIPSLPFPVLTARLALIYGPGQAEDFLLPWLIRRCLTGETSVIRRPNSRRDMVFVEDVVDGLKRLGSAGLESGTIVNLSTGVAPTVREIVEMVLAATGVDPALVTFRQEEGPNFRADHICGAPDRAKQLLGWSAKMPLREGIRFTADQMRERVPA